MAPGVLYTYCSAVNIFKKKTKNNKIVKCFKKVDITTLTIVLINGIASHMKRLVELYKSSFLPCFLRVGWQQESEITKKKKTF